MINLPIGEVLKQLGYISDEQLKSALEYQKQNINKRVGEILVELGYVTEENKIEALAKRLTIPIIDINNTEFDNEAVKLIPYNIAREHKIIAFAIENNTLSVITSDPLNMYGMEEVTQITGMPLRMYLALQKDIDNAINYYYAEVNAKKATENINKVTYDVEGIEALEALELQQGGGDDAPVIQLVNSLVVRGYNAGASDIHIEPFEDKTDVRMRIDGTLIKYVELQTAMHQTIVARIKILADLDIAEKRIPQDGHYRVRINSESINVRVSVIPTVFGEKVVLRILATKAIVDNHSTYGMTRENYNKFSKVLSSPNGIIYITGPTGSGKSTTLYMVLETLAKANLNISTIEDPVEKTIANLNQMQVNNQAGVTFEVGMRALLRQDPDIIMVGETRDSQTANISVRAAITGHLVFSTLHTNDAVSSIVRLQDMGVEPYLIANSVVCLIAQRLVKKVCPQCAVDRQTAPHEQLMLGEKIQTIKQAKGCQLCNNTGYIGRTAIHEIVVVDKELRKLITNGNTTEEMLEHCLVNQNMQTLKDGCLQLVKEGVTTMEEYSKIFYYSN